MNAREVPFFNYPALFKAHEADFGKIFCDVGRRGAFIKQQDLLTFENRLASYLSIAFTLGVGNATDGLEVASIAAGIHPGDEVIISSHTMLATAVAVHFAGATPVPVECGPDHLIDAQAAEAAITSRTRALMPTQLNGRTCDMDLLGSIVAKHGLLMVEDAAQALGSRFKGRCAGTFGNSAAISFYPAKLLGCFGDGGAVVTENQSVYDHALELCNFGRNATGKVVRWGFNSRLDNLQAAILNFQFDKYEQVVLRRRQIAALYEEHLGDVAEIVLPPGPESSHDHYDVYQNYEIEAENRNGLKTFLADRGVGTLIQWNGEAIHHLEALGLKKLLPYTDSLFKRMLMLPMNMSVVDEDVMFVCDTVRLFYGYPL